MDYIFNKPFKANESEEIVLSNTMITIMERNNNSDFADFLQEKNVITQDECNTFKAMIYSPDPENYEVAKCILQEKSKPLFLNEKKFIISKL